MHGARIYSLLAAQCVSFLFYNCFVFALCQTSVVNSPLHVAKWKGYQSIKKDKANSPGTSASRSAVSVNQVAHQE